MIKSLTFHPERLAATPLRAGRLPPETGHRLVHALKAGWRNDVFWLAEQYYKGKHAYASFMELECTTETHLPVECVRQDLIWLYLINGEVTLSPQLTLRQGQYAPIYMGTGEYVFTFPSGHHRILFLATQFKWMKRYENTEFAPFRRLLQTDELGFLPGTVLPIRTKHLRSLAHLRQLAHGSSFRQDIAIYNQLADLLDGYLADIAALTMKGPCAGQETMAQIVTEITAYLNKEVVLGNVPSLPELADLFNLSETTLKTYFRKVADVSVGRFIERIRMAEAKCLLLTTDMKITQIAYQLGYDRLDTFDRAFKRFHRCTPHEMSARG